MENQAAQEIARLKKAGKPVAPVVVEGRTIATTFWGKAWCDNLENYQDYANRLPRGRTYVRNGLVIDLWIGPREVTAKVSGAEIYSVRITIEALPIAAWKSICADCAGRVASLVELLRGRLSKAVMDRVCRQGDGLFPEPAGIRFSCSCPDSASLCKHVAAALYGTGTRLDAEPELLFRLRAVDAGEIITNLDAALPATRASATGPRLETGDLSEIFGIDMATPAAPTRGKASTPAKSSLGVKISRPETGDRKKAKRIGPPKPTRARQSPAISNAPVQ
ncbi:MAG: SWIM zinc finger family protein, partial [Methylocella sp.]